MISESAFQNAAEKIGCQVAAIKAVAEVESNGNGFLEDGSPKILFEAHIFGRLTDHAYDYTHPNISSRVWNKSLYTKHEWDRLGEAVQLNRDAALQSTSWGAFQIMGFNYKQCGCKTVSDFVDKMCSDEDSQLELFVNFIINSGLGKLLVDKNFTEFAERYNGPSYKKNNYHTKIANAFVKNGGL